MLGLIIFGRRSTTRVRNRGTFACPRCGTDRTYAHKQVRRWFTLYFIPVIPLGTIGEYLQCESCAGTFKAELAPPGLPQAQIRQK